MAIKKTGLGDYESFSSRFLENRNAIPMVTSSMVKGLSDQRRSVLASETEQGLFRDGTGSSNNSETVLGRVIASSGGSIKKMAQDFSSGMYGGGGMGGASSGNTVMQSPEIYSPLWLTSNLSLPRDRATINAWCRSFFALNPFVHNAVSLHSTYPISKLSIKSPNKDIERFFNDMIEEIDLMNICVQIAQEYWLLGEAFVYAELDEGKGKWSRLHIQNPDFMIVKRTVVASEPIIMLRPDENLKKIIQSNRPGDIEQKKQLNQQIIDSVRRGENIPLDNFHVSHLARRISPYEIRGTGLPVCIFRQLMLFDKLRECYSEDTEVLTDDGFKNIASLVSESSIIEQDPNFVNGALLNEHGEIESILSIKNNFKVACFNPETESIEYHRPTGFYMSKYNGKMIHFKGNKIDCLVSPNHKMWLKPIINNVVGEYGKVPASELSHGIFYKMKCTAGWKGKEIESVKVLNCDVPIEIYLKFLGYVISEGCITKNGGNTIVSQSLKSRYYDDIRNNMHFFGVTINKHVGTHIKKKVGYNDVWAGTISSVDLNSYLRHEIGITGKCDSRNKRIPRWILDLDTKYLKILLSALVDGDGSRIVLKHGNKRYRYSTTSKQLADDIYELIFKLGFAPILQSFQRRTCVEHVVRWSETGKGLEPQVYGNKNVGKSHFNEVDYDGIVWCFEVPTGLFITRRNGKITVQGNSKFVQADSLINPLTVIKIGSADYKPTHADLESWRATFECHDKETEVLTDIGFKKFNEVMNYQEVEGAIKISAQPKPGIKLACFNSINNQMEYHQPTGASLYNYSGEMYHYNNKKIDIKVTPIHKMWVSKRGSYDKYGEWHKKEAQELNVSNYYKFRSHINWEGRKDIENVNVIGKEVPIKIYLEFMGYLLSEGSIYKSVKQHSYKVAISQSTITEKNYYLKMKSCMVAIADLIGKKSHHFIKNNGMWEGIFSCQELYQFFKQEIGIDGDTTSAFKHVPRWILGLSSELLSVLLDAMVMGDGHLSNSRVNKLRSSRYTTISKQLADDIYEIVYKCGYVPLLTTTVRSNKPVYDISWSRESNNGKGYFPVIHNGNGKHESKILNVEKYDGKVWCFEVPTGLFITRRNGKITIQGNSAESNKHFKIFTHEGVDIQNVGFGAGIFDTSGDITQLIKEIMIGLFVPQVMLDGGSDTTYANGGVALDVLRQRYMQFRNMMSIWLKRKIFAPISKIQGFYDYSGGEKQLIVPEIDWNHMSLFDAGDYINTMVTLTQGVGDQKRASLHTLYRSLGLEFEDETRKIRKENIQNAIAKKETEALEALDLNALRALDDEDEIPEPLDRQEKKAPEGAVPGETSDMSDLGSPPPMPNLEAPSGPGVGGPPPPPAPAGPPNP
jgi:hypothetical protein